MQKEPLKVLFVLTSSGVGGAQRYAHDLSSSLSKERFNARIITGGKDLKWLSNRLSPFLLANDIIALFELARTFKKERPNIIHLNNSKAGVIGSFSAYLYNSFLRPKDTVKAKVVFTAHGWVFNPQNNVSSFGRFFYVFMHRIAASFQDAIINVSGYDHTLALTYRIASPDKLFTIHNGIDPQITFLSREDAREEIQRRLATKNLKLTTNNWVGSLGRLTKEKNYETLIAAATEIPDSYFFIVGDGEERENLQLAINNLQLGDRVFIVPPKGDDAKLLKAFDVFALSSIKEGFPYSLLEALLAGLPTATTPAGGIPEIARACPEMIRLAPMRNANALAYEIRASLIGPKTPKAPFTLSRMSEQTEAVYTSLAS